MIGIIASTAISFSAPDAPAAPRRHCGIETRTWCLDGGDYQISLKSVGDSRIWTIVSQDDPVEITVRESTSCDDIESDDILRSTPPETRLVEKRRSAEGRLNTEISYEVPAYQCSVHISWDSAPDDLAQTKGQTRRLVFSTISLGVGDKQSLMFPVQATCIKSGGVWDWDRLTCSIAPAIH